MKKITNLVLVLVMAVGLLAAGCGGEEEKTASAPAGKEELIVGTEPSFAPFEFPEKDSKEFTGFDMDLIRACLLYTSFGYDLSDGRCQFYSNPDRGFCLVPGFTKRGRLLAKITSEAAARN